MVCLILFIQLVTLSNTNTFISLGIFPNIDVVIHSIVQAIFIICYPIAVIVPFPSSPKNL